MKTICLDRMKAFRFLLIAASIVLLCSACVTQASKSGSVAQESAKSKKICRSASETGSRIRSKSICLTQEEWAVVDARQKEIDANRERDTDKFFRRSLEKSGQISGSGLDNPNAPSP